MTQASTTGLSLNFITENKDSRELKIISLLTYMADDIKACLIRGGRVFCAHLRENLYLHIRPCSERERAKLFGTLNSFNAVFHVLLFY